MSQPFVLATSPGEADQEFADIGALARAILVRRADHPAGHGLAAISAVVSRGGLPGGKAVAVRVLDGSANGQGACLGYAFLPGWDKQPQTLMAAIRAAQAAAAPKQPAPVAGDSAREKAA